MKILILLVLLVLLGWHLHAEQVSINRFKGLNNNTNSLIIDPSEAQDLLNVDVSPGGGSVKKRPGYGVFKEINNPFHGGHHFFDAGGNEVQLWGNGVNLMSSINGANFTNPVSSATDASTWDCADTQGNAYCVNSSRDAYIRTNGTSMTWYATPLGTMVESTPDRIVVSGVSGNPNAIYVSESNNFVNFTTGVNQTDAFTEIIAAPGSKISHIRWGCGKLLWWKNASFGYLDFEDQYNAEVKIISDTIGTFDNTSAIDPGGQVWFRGQDGHTWKYDCSGLTKESIEITPNVQASGNRTSNSWTQTTSAELAAGSIINLDTTTVSGTVGLPGFSHPSGTNLSNWQAIQGAWASDGTHLHVSTTTGPGLTRAAIRGPAMNSFTGATTWYVTAEVLTTVSFIPGNAKTCIGLVNASTQGYHLCMEYNSSTNIDQLTLTNADYSTAYGIASLGDTAATYHTMTLAYNATSGRMTAYWDGVVKSTATNTTYTNLIYPFMYGMFNPPSTNRIIVKQYGVRTASGTLYSAVHNAPDLNSWGFLDISHQLNGGAEDFYLRSSTNPFTVLSATPAWTSQGAGDFITISTGTYFQLASTFTVTVGTQNPTLSEFTVNWAEGTAVDQAYMIYFDNAIWEAVAFGDGQNTNNYIFRKDLINDGWTLYDIPSNGFLIQANSLYFGSPVANVYKFGNSASDNGEPITAYWRSKTFSGTDPFLQNQLNQIDVIAKKDHGTYLVGTYTLNSSTSTSYAINLSTGSNIAQSRKILPSGKSAYTWDFIVADDSASSAWELLGYRMMFSPQPYRPTTQ